MCRAAVQLLHRIHLGLETSPDDAAEFVKFKASILICIGAPAAAIQNRASRAVLGADSVLAVKARWLERYQTALKAQWPEDAAGWSDAQLTLLVSNFMDSLLFAGGTAIPITLGYCIGLLYSAKGQAPLD